MSLAFGASFDIFHDIFYELRPPVLSGYKLCGSFDSGMSVYWRVVVSLDDGVLVM